MLLENVAQLEAYSWTQTDPTCVCVQNACVYYHLCDASKMHQQRVKYTPTAGDLLFMS